MDNCKIIRDRIVFYDELIDAEREQVRLHTESCTDCRKYSREIELIVTTLTAARCAPHVSQDLLVRYGLHQAEPEGPDFDSVSLSAQVLADVSNHLETCTECRQQVDKVVAEFREIDAHLVQAGVPNSTVEAVFVQKSGHEESWLSDKLAGFLQGIATLAQPSFYPIAATAVAALIIGVWVSPLLRSGDEAFLQLAKFEPTQIAFFTRGETTGELSEALTGFDQQRYAWAAERLEQFIAAHPEDPAVAHAHYVAGLAQLSQAVSDFLGRFHRVDQGKLNKSEHHLQLAIQQTENLHLKEEAWWHLSKVYILRQDVTRAKQALGNVIQISGTRVKAAEEMIVQLDKLTTH